MDLKDLRLANTKVESIEALVSSINMEWLDISNTQVQDLSPLAGMTKLKRFYMPHCNAVTDVKPLAGCEALKVFRLLAFSVVVNRRLGDVHQFVGD